MKHKRAEHHSPKRQSQLYYFTPLGAPDIKGPSQTAGKKGMSPAADSLGQSLCAAFVATATHLSLSPMSGIEKGPGAVGHPGLC